MPLYMDIHNLPEGTTPEDVAKAHAKDMEIQRKYGVEYHKYWVNEAGNKVFCLAHAPNAEAAECVHREAHGMMAEKIIEVEPDVAEVFLGGTETNPSEQSFSLVVALMTEIPGSERFCLRML